MGLPDVTTEILTVERGRDEIILRIGSAPVLALSRRANCSLVRELIEAHQGMGWCDATGRLTAGD